jgi:hypothetical protein
MKPVRLHLRLQRAPAKLLRTAIRGMGRSVYLSVRRGNGPAFDAGECIWADRGLSIFVKAHEGDDGLVVDLRVIVDPPPSPPGAAALAA